MFRLIRLVPLTVTRILLTFRNTLIVKGILVLSFKKQKNCKRDFVEVSKHFIRESDLTDFQLLVK